MSVSIYCLLSSCCRYFLWLCLFHLFELFTQSHLWILCWCCSCPSSAALGSCTTIPTLSLAFGTQDLMLCLFTSVLLCKQYAESSQMACLLGYTLHTCHLAMAESQQPMANQWLQCACNPVSCDNTRSNCNTIRCLA